MSKGPGKWQGLIISELEIRDCFNLRELLGPTFTKAQYNALLRGMPKLERTGKISVHRFAYGTAKTWVHRFGTTITTDNRRLVKVSSVP